MNKPEIQIEFIKVAEFVVIFRTTFSIYSYKEELTTILLFPIFQQYFDVYSDMN